MKNKKLIPLTIAIVAVVLMGMLGLSGIVESTWGQPEQTDNTLNAEIVNDAEPAFDYPYIAVNAIGSMDELPSDVQEMYSPYYLNANIVAAYQYCKPEENMVSYQDISNRAGEFLKDALGITQQTKNTALLIYDNRNPENIHYKYFYCADNEGYSIIYFFTMDAATGKITYIETHDSRAVNNRILAGNITADKKELENVISIVKDYLILLGIDAPVKDYGISVRTYPCAEEPARLYTVNIRLEGTAVYYQMTVREENGFWLSSFGRKADFIQ